MARIMLVLEREEVQKNIAYQLICETRYGRTWDSMSRKRRWLSEFSDKERESAKRLFSLAHTWTLVTGVPDEVTMSTATFGLWKRIEAFCASL